MRPKDSRQASRPTDSTGSRTSETPPDPYKPDEGLVAELLAGNPKLTRERAIQLLELAGD